MAAEQSLKNQFLLAMPGLAGSYFGGTITYIWEHSEAGAMGLMVNRPTTVSLAELLGQLNIDVGEVPLEVPVMEGGPVGGERGFVLHAIEEKLDRSYPGSSDLGNGLMITTAREVLEDIGQGQGPSDYLIALGYAGWEQGQLENELKENAWLTCPAELDVLFNTPFEDRVNKAAAGLGIDFRLVSGQAGHA